MTVESSFQYPSDLNASYPAAGDNKSEGDDHLRGIKTCLKTTLPNVTGAITATQAELNILDGATLSTAELNILDGVTATAAELNALDGITASTAELNIMDGVTATAAEINTLDGITATVTELNYTDGVTGAIQAQLDAKAPLASPALTGTPTAPTAAPSTATTQIATTAFVDALVTATAFASVLPTQTGNSGKYVTTDGSNASWATPTGLQISNTPAGTIAATTVQAALNELDTDKQATLVSGTNIKTIDGTSLLGSGDITRSPGDHYIKVTTASGHGSTNNKIRIFSALESSAGTHVTRATSGTNGDSYTIAAGGDGLYAIMYLDNTGATSKPHGISKNSAQLTTAIDSITAANRLGITWSGPDEAVMLTVCTRLVAGDVIRPHSNGDQDETVAARTMFEIRKIGL